MDNPIPGLPDRREAINFLDDDPTIVPYSYFRLRRALAEANKEGSTSAEASQDDEASARWAGNSCYDLRGAEHSAQQRPKPLAQSQDREAFSWLDIQSERPPAEDHPLGLVSWLILIVSYTLFVLQLKGLLF